MRENAANLTDDFTTLYEDDVISKVSWYYYHNNLTQQEIADILGISRMKVIKLLEKAKQTGVIQFRFRSDVSKSLKIEEEVKSKYMLKGCFIVPTSPNLDTLNTSLGRAGATFLLNHSDDELFINISYGDTTAKFLDFFSSHYNSQVSCVSLTGGVNHYLPLAPSGLFRSRLFIIPAPLFASSKEFAETIKKEKEVQSVMSLIPISSASVIGIGAIGEDSTIVKENILSEAEMLLLKRKGAVADLLGHFIDSDGNIVSEEFESKTISTDLNTLKNLSNVIGIAGGPKKIDAIRAVLKGGYLKHLITDEATAIELLKN